MISIPDTAPPLWRRSPYKRDVLWTAAFGWLRAGWRDFCIRPWISLFYGVAIFVASIASIAGLFALSIDYVLLPAFAGFLVIAPALAIGLYEKSRLIEEGAAVTLLRTVFVRPRSGGQILFTGVLLCLVFLLWMRAAVLLFALVFGLSPFPGFNHMFDIVLVSPSGWLLLSVGTAVGALFASFAFAISVLSIPMLLGERTDAFTAMGTSIAVVWNNLAVMLVWGGIVFVLTVLSVLSGLVGLVVAFPVLGHATWHMYKEMRP